MFDPDEEIRRIEAAAQAARTGLEIAPGAEPRLGLVLGSGMGAVADGLNLVSGIEYARIPHFPCSTVAGHAGRLVRGTLGGVPVVAMQGRVHGYEGYTPREVVFPVRVLARLGIRQLILTNAAGSLHPDWKPGTLAVIRDHIAGLPNPLIGPNLDELGPRFFDMTEAYAPRLRALARETAAGLGMRIEEGVYYAAPGPSYETPAEIRAFRALGADLVGMSTVPEVIAARHMGLEVLAISLVTNAAAGVTQAAIDHQEVMEIGARAQTQISRWLSALAPALPAMERRSRI